jgi:hypothetical protein
MNSEEAKIFLNDIERDIRELRRLFDLFFTGEAKVAPYEMRRSVQQRIARMQTSRPPNTGMRYRLNSLTNSFNAYQRYWDRVLYQIETGTYQPDRFKADMRVGRYDKNPREIERPKYEPPATRRKAPDDESNLKLLYNQFIEARRVTNESIKVPFEAFSHAVKKQIPGLKDKFGEALQLKVVIENNKTKVKGARE